MMGEQGCAGGGQQELAGQEAMQRKRRFDSRPDYKPVECPARMVTVTTQKDGITHIGRRYCHPGALKP
jgi:hypothetical protein